jgi:polyisoprenoid-binding protein YceI
MSRYFAFVLAPFLLLSASYAMDFKPPTFDRTLIPAGKYTIDTKHANIIWKISHLGFSQYAGRFNTFTGELNFDSKQPEKSSVSVSIDPKSVDTNNGVLEKELQKKEYFNTAKFPEITFKSTKLTMLEPGERLGMCGG